MAVHKASGDIKALLSIMRLLRSPEGCPWDREQTSESLIPHTLEEAYEVADAVASGNRYKICEELGDLLLQIVFHCQIAEERGEFEFADVVYSITDKLIRRHPHIFGEDQASTVQDVNNIWQSVKESEEKTGKDSSVPPLPALLLLQKVSGQLPVNPSKDDLVQRIIELAEQANRENRCLEAEVKGFCAKFWQ